MRVAVFGKKFNESFRSYCQTFISILEKWGCEVIIYQPFYRFLKKEIILPVNFSSTFLRSDDLTNVNMIFTIGGDGTFLEAATLVRNQNIPIAGINSGRLGFLADISKEDIEVAMSDIFQNRHQLRNLNLLEVNTGNRVFGDLNFALNELSISKRDSSSMITVHVYLNGEFLNSYWADGLIIATATGSTAYSLSVGGPILHPDSQNFVLSPIAPHNLTVRPLVIPNDMEITLRVDARGGKYLASIDSRSRVMDEQIVITIRKANFSIPMVVRTHHNYYDTLRNKLMWGADKRN
ncbi:MAG: NAD kinase [Marinilabiliaceae bacterium]|nr:NAD kinase [Marinilabiliaceae bacterium]